MMLLVMMLHVSGGFRRLGYLVEGPYFEVLIQGMIVYLGDIGVPLFWEMPKTCYYCHSSYHYYSCFVIRTYIHIHISIFIFIYSLLHFKCNSSIVCIYIYVP